MKLYISKIVYTACLIIILLIIINFFTGIINEKITAGASVISLLLMILVMKVTSQSKLEKTKKQ